MKGGRLVLWIVGLAVISCGEIAPRIDFSEPIVLSRDTTYFNHNLQNKPLKNVLIEDISGVKCNICPNAALVAHNLKEENPGRVVVITEHPLGVYSKLTEPYEDSQDSLNCNEATDIVETIIQNVGSLPNGAINRKELDATNPIIPLRNYDSWRSYVEQELQEKGDVDVELELIQLSDRKVIANIKATFYEAQTLPTMFSIFILESEIVSRQKMPDRSPNYDYVHNYILREGVTFYTGTEFNEPIERGTVFEKGFEIDIPEKYVIENCAIVVLINRDGGSSSEVLQCIEKAIQP